MPNPRTKHSKSRRDKRRTHKKLDTPAMSVCPHCKAPKVPHRACPSCGMYKGRNVVEAGV